MMEFERGRTYRVLKILQWLGGEVPLTTADIQRRFKEDVSRRNIQRDLITIERAGFPVLRRRTATQGNSWSLDSTRMPMLPRLLGVEEYMAALLLREGLGIFKGTSFQEEINALIRKLDQIAPEEYYAEEDLDILDTLPFGEVDYAAFSDIIRTFVAAIRHKHICEVAYQSRRSAQPKLHTIAPIRLILHRGGLYVAAYKEEHEQSIFLAIDRVQDVKPTEASMRVWPALDLSDIRHRQFGLMPGNGLEWVKVRFDPYAAPLIRHRKWHQSQSVVEKKNGGLELTMLVGISADLESWLLRWTPHLKVLQPKSLKERLKATMRKGLEAV